jgi:cell wall-associated NlpC family hydrolase
MKNIKVKPSGHKPRELTDTSRIPKELIHKVLCEVNDNTAQTVQQKHSQTESPEQYAVDRIERIIEDVSNRAGQGVSPNKRLIKNLKKPRQKEDMNDAKGAENSSFFSSSENKTYYQRKNRAQKQSIKARQKATGKNTIKIKKRAIKTSKQTVKASAKAVKTSAQAVKAAQKTARATAKATKTAARAAKAAAKAAAAAAKAVVKATSAIIKAAVAAIKGLVMFIAAGGWVAVIIIIVVALIAMIVGSAFGIFFSDEAGEGVPIKEAVVDISADYQAQVDAKISALSAAGSYDEIIVTYEGDTDGDSASINNWSDVLTVFAVKFMGEKYDVITITLEKIDELKKVFQTMNTFTSRTETKTKEVIVINDDGEEETSTHITLLIYIKFDSLTYEEANAKYGFTDEQAQIANEMMSPAYYTLYAELLGVELYGGADLTAIISNLPVGTKGADVVKAALTKLGAPYVLGAKGEKRFDCSGLVYWSIAQVDLALGKKMYTNAAGQAKYCFDGGYAVGQSELVVGDLVFWQNLNCTGCHRWKEVHHTGIYIGDGKVIEASASKGRVVIRDLWSSASYPLFMFGRPY